MARTEPRADEEHFGEASLDDAQAANPPDADDMIEPEVDPLDTEVEDAEIVAVEEVGEEEAEEFEHKD
ncbi:MAG TPA: hypothetical protein VFY99_07585 [Solirubrobacterales bacterium]